jgi:hypothetical protein
LLVLRFLDTIAVDKLYITFMDIGLIVHCLLTRKGGTEVLILKRSLDESYLPGVWDVPGVLWSGEKIHLKG